LKLVAALVASRGGRCAGAPRRTRLARRLAAAGLALGLGLGGAALRATSAGSAGAAGGAGPGQPYRVARPLGGGTLHRQPALRRSGPGAGLAAVRQVPPPPPGFVIPGPPPGPPGPPRILRPPGPGMGVLDPYRVQRRGMVDVLLQRGISQPEVLAAMDQVPRHLFLPERMRAEAYADRALQVGPSRTIYQPYVVALMTSLLDLKHGDTVLEVGTGTGYHAAVLSRIARRVYSMEIDPVAASQAQKALAVMGYHNVEVWAGDGYRGLPERAPFNAILLSAAAPRIPAPLIDQLRMGGKMVAPVGGGVQDLLVITKTPQGIEKRTVAPVRVSPMTGQVQDGH
jgi:protein-L-isoaspartate(D-aspartate) O-methyltransferase